MKTRIITAAVFIPALLLLLLLAPTIVTAVVWGLLMAVSSYELVYGTGFIRENRLVVYTAIMAFATSLWSHYDSNHAFGQIGLMIFICLLFVEMMLSHIKITFDKICICAVAGFVIPFFLGSLIRILVMSRIGRFMVLIPFIVAFTSDAGAYFVGRYFGRHKLSPVISQHKTIEGAVGGVLTAVMCMLIYCLVLRYGFGFQVNYAVGILYGFLGSLAGIVGDLCFSVVKRQAGIKDYGNIIPGHGGILDRFDSMVTIGPLMESLLILIPLAV